MSKYAPAPKILILHEALDLQPGKDPMNMWHYRVTRTELIWADRVEIIRRDGTKHIVKDRNAERQETR